MLSPWIDFSLKPAERELQQSCQEHDIDPERVALIRKRVRRVPTNFVLNVLIPFFIIVEDIICSLFSVHWS